MKHIFKRIKYVLEVFQRLLETFERLPTFKEKCKYKCNTKLLSTMTIPTYYIAFETIVFIFTSCFLYINLLF